MQNLTSKQENQASPAETATPSFFERFNRSRVATIAIFAVVALAFFFMNHWTPLYNDDFLYSVVRDSNPAERISDLSGLVYSSVDHYMEINGRFANAPLCMLLEWIGKPATDFITTAVLLAMVIAIYKLVGIKNLRNTLFLFLFGATFWFAPAFVETCLWLCGSANYLWTAMIVFWFLVFHQKMETGWCPSKIQYVGLVVLSVIAGWMHEGTSVGVCFGLFFYYVFNRGKITKEKLFYILPFFVGTALVVFSPGILSRGMSTSDGGSIANIILRLARGYLHMIYYPPFWILLLSIIVAVIFCRERAVRFVKENSLLLLIVLGTTPILAAFGVVPGMGVNGRATFCFFFLTAICILRFFEPEILNFKKTFAVSSLALFAGAATLFVSLIPEYIRVKATHDEFYSNIAKTENRVVLADGLASTKPYILGTSVSSFLDINNSWTTRALSNYFRGGRDIIVVPRELYSLIYEEDKLFEHGAEYEWKKLPYGFFIRKARPEEKVKELSPKLLCEANHEKMSLIDEVLFWVVNKTKVYQLEGYFEPRKTDSGASVFEWDFPSGRYFLVSDSTFHGVPVITTKVVDAIPVKQTIEPTEAD